MTNEVFKKAVREIECQTMTPRGIISLINEWRENYNTDIKFNFVIGHTYEELVGDGYMTQYMSFFEPDTDDDYTEFNIPDEFADKEYFVFSVDDYEGDGVITFELERFE